MFSPKVVLWGGIAGVCCGLFWLMSAVPSSGGGAFALALLLSLGGLVSLYSRLARQGGRLGLAGIALGIIGTVLALATNWWGTTSGILSNSGIEREPALATQTILILMLAIVTLGIGLALLGVANLRAKTLHRWQMLPLGLGLLHALFGITGWLGFYVPMSQGRNPFDPWPPQGYALIATEFVLLGLGWIGLGTMLATEAEAKIAQSPPASA